MRFIHWIPDQCCVQSTGSAEHFLLCARAMEKAASRVNAISEIQRKRAEAALKESPRGLKRRFIGDLYACFGATGLLLLRQRCVRRDAAFLGTGSLYVQTPVQLPVSIAYIVPRGRRFHCGPSKRLSHMSGNAQFLPPFGGEVVGIHARKQDESKLVICHFCTLIDCASDRQTRFRVFGARASARNPSNLIS